MALKMNITLTCIKWVNLKALIIDEVNHLNHNNHNICSKTIVSEESVRGNENRFGFLETKALDPKFWAKNTQFVIFSSYFYT